MKKIIKKVLKFSYNALPYLLVAIGFYHLILAGAYFLNGNFEQASIAFILTVFQFLLTAFIIMLRQTQETMQIMREHIEFLTNFVEDVLDVATEYKTFEKKFSKRMKHRIAKAAGKDLKDVKVKIEKVDMSKVRGLEAYLRDVGAWNSNIDMIMMRIAKEKAFDKGNIKRIVLEVTKGGSEADTLLQAIDDYFNDKENEEK